MISYQQWTVYINRVNRNVWSIRTKQDSAFLIKWRQGLKKYRMILRNINALYIKYLFLNEANDWVYMEYTWERSLEFFHSMQLFIYFLTLVHPWFTVTDSDMTVTLSWHFFIICSLKLSLQRFKTALAKKQIKAVVSFLLIIREQSDLKKI